MIRTRHIVCMATVMVMQCILWGNARAKGKSTNTNAAEKPSILKTVGVLYRSFPRVVEMPVASRPLGRSGRSFLGTEPAIRGDVLNFPNPCRLSEGTQIGYRLSGDNADIQIEFYDMLGNKIATKDVASGQEGGIGGNTYNKVLINKATFGGYDLSSGVYMYLIIHNGKKLGKGKMAIIP